MQLSLSHKSCMMNACRFSTPEDSHLSEDDGKVIRTSLFSLIKFYVMNTIKSEELTQIMSFLLAVKQPALLLEAMDLLISLLENPNRKQDQLILLLYEAYQAEMFYKLLTYPRQPIIFYEKIVKKHLRPMEPSWLYLDWYITVVWTSNLKLVD
uniref:DUF4704 domain-containing protein n=1 Tax=Biomphalaria glabrata TaxID=6526 RepID=A0A2C9M2Q2_BIOGL